MTPRPTRTIERASVPPEARPFIGLRPPSPQRGDGGQACRDVARESVFGCPPSRRKAPLRRGRLHSLRERSLERETGIEPATNSLEGCDSTTELLPPSEPSPTPQVSRHWLAKTKLTEPDGVRLRVRRSRVPPNASARQTSLTRRAKSGGEGRIRTSEATWATDLQSVAFDRSATSPTLVPVSSGRPPHSVPDHTASGAKSMELAEGFEPPTG